MAVILLFPNRVKKYVLMVIQNKVTNAQCDRELILIWLGGKSETTQVSYRSTVEKFIEFIAKPLSEVKLEDLQLWERGLVARFKPTTVANKVLLETQFLVVLTEFFKLRQRGKSINRQLRRFFL